MGYVHDTLQALGVIKARPAGTAYLVNAMKNANMEVGAESVAELTQAEADLIAYKLDRMAPSGLNPVIPTMVARNYETLCVMVQRVKKETGGIFSGMKAVGSNLDLGWLIPQLVGDSRFLNKDTTGSCGLWAGTSAQVYVWEHSFTTAGTIEHFIPSQTTTQYCGVLHMGLADTMDNPKGDFIRFTIAGQSMPDQSLQQLKMAYKPSGSSAVAMEFEYPIYVGPLTLEVVDVEPNLSGGADALQLLSIVVAQASVLSN
jgi:hypothetical protein